MVRSLAEHLRHWLPTQHWFRAVGEVPDSVVPLELEVLAEGWPTLVWCPVEVIQPTGAVDRYQLVLAMHRVVSPVAEPDALVGVVAAPAGTAHVYDALGDPAGAVLLARHLAPDVKVEAPEPIRRRDGRTSVVGFDDRWEMTIYRHLGDGSVADIAVPLALARRSVAAVNAPVATWHHEGWDLGAMRRESGRAPDGVEVTRRSLSELLHRRCPPPDTRADFWHDAERLGAATGEVHVGLAEAYGTSALDGAALRDELMSRLRAGAPGRLDLAAVETALTRLASAGGLGCAIRVHGDLRLGHAVRERRGWQLRGFCDAEATRKRSPLVDVATMLRSFREAATLAVTARTTVAATPDPRSPESPVERSVDRELRLLADAWVERATAGFIAGYTSVRDIHELLPADRTSRDALLAVHELVDELDLVKWELAAGRRVADVRDATVIRLVGADLVDLR